eukprot:2863446-Ditylum_brightwellii.AAC.1
MAVIDGIIQGCPKAIRQRNTLGQTPLHLCLSNNISAEVTKCVYDAWPDAVSVRNELSKTPLDYWRENGGNEVIGDIIKENASITTTITTFLLRKDEKTIMMEDDPVILQRGHHLLLEVLKDHNDKIYTNYGRRVEFGKLFLEQLHSRNMLFDELLTEFSKLIDFTNKKVIQQAAAVQALCSTHLTTAGEEGSIDFSCFSSAALWYQQEILSLVMRVYCEDQLMDNLEA